MTDATAPDGLEQVLAELDNEACELLKRYLAVGHSSLILRLSDDCRYRIITPNRGSAILAIVIDEIPAMLESAAKAANGLAKASGRKH